MFKPQHRFQLQRLKINFCGTKVAKKLVQATGSPKLFQKHFLKAIQCLFVVFLLTCNLIYIQEKILKPLDMTEDFLQFVWEQTLYDQTNLTTVAGEKVEVLEPGTRNIDSGPDFFNARIKIDDTQWAGNVEIHRNASDWLRHHHHGNGAYENVILHVVQNFDRQICRLGGEKIPTLVLPVPPRLIYNFRLLMESPGWIPCCNQFQIADRFLLKIGLNRLMIERLENRTQEITTKLQTNSNDWNETFYQLLARSFGFKTNSIPFELMAMSLPQSIPAKHRDNIFQLEALFFGQSGLLNEKLFGDDYYLKLGEEYRFLAKKYHLKPIPAHLWKFLRMRPVNFPTVRIAQFAALFHHASGLFSRMVESGSLDEIKKLLNVKASDYWDTHYRFGTDAEFLPKHLGEVAANGLIINTLIPVLFEYGENSGKNFLKDKALEWLDKLPAEQNSVVSGWAKMGIPADSAFETQALIHLKSRYCDLKRCLHCHIGSKLVKSL